MEEEMPQIIVNGKSYASLDQMPPDIRKIYEHTLGLLGDQNQNGVPDIMEGAFAAAGSINPMPAVINVTQFSVDGKMVSSADELPPEAREKYEQALAKLGNTLGDADQNGVPDIFEGKPPTTIEMTTLSARPAATPNEAAQTEPVVSVIGGAAPKAGRILIVAVILIVTVLAVLLALGVFNGF
jgi:hypothetical protein